MLSFSVPWLVLVRYCRHCRYRCRFRFTKSPLDNLNSIFKHIYVSLNFPLVKLPKQDSSMKNQFSREGSTQILDLRLQYKVILHFNLVIHEDNYFEVTHFTSQTVDHIFLCHFLTIASSNFIIVKLVIRKIIFCILTRQIKC